MEQRKRKRGYDPNELEKLVREGKSNREISEIMGVTIRTVAKWVQQSNLTGIRPHGGGNRKPEREAQLTEKKKLPVRFNADRHMCKTCQYRTGWQDKGRGFGCDYWDIEGHSRICDVEECTKYVKGKRKQKQRKKKVM